jgi:transposase-like protein
MNIDISHKRKYSTISDDIHTNIINLYLSGTHIIVIANSFDKKYNTVNSIIQRYKKTNQIKLKKNIREVIINLL